MKYNTLKELGFKCGNNLRAGEAGLRRPTQIRAKRASRRAHPSGAGSLVPPRQARGARTGLYSGLSFPSQVPF